MKKHFISSLWMRIGTALLILSISFIVYSCHKEAKLTQQEINAAKAAQNFPVTDASAWFSANKTTLTTKIKINSDASFLNRIADFTPLWDSARTAVDTNYYVVEAPAKYAQRLGFSTDSITSNINGSTRLLILKSKKLGTLSAVLMQIRTNTNISSSNVHYMAVPASFSGNIFYTSLQGAFICGYIYSAGKIIKSCKGGSSVTTPGGPRILQAYNPGDGNNCETITTNWYMQTCYWNADDSFDHCTVWQYMYTTVDTYCDDNNNSGGGGAVPAPPECPEGTHPAGNDDGGNDGGNNGGLNVESVNGKLVVHFAYGSSSNCVPDTTKKAIDSCAQAQKMASIQAFIDKMNSLKDNIHNSFESGYYFTDPTNLNTYTSITGVANTMSLPFTLNSSQKIAGYMHVQPDGAVYSNGTPVDVNSTPTGDDFSSIYEIYSKHNMVDPYSFVMGTLTSKGTVYLVQITDESVFAKWGAANLTSTPNHDTAFQTAIVDSYHKYYDIQFMNSDQAHELALLDNLAASGLTLLRGNYINMNKWSPIMSTKVNSQTKIIVINCNNNQN